MKKNTKRKKQYTLAELIEGLDITIQGDPNCIIKGVCTIQDAKPDHITFLTNPLYKKYLATTQAAAVILGAEEAEICPVNALITRNPYYSYAKIASLFCPRSIPEPGIHATAVIGKDCQIDSTATIGAQCVIEDGVKIAAGVVLGAGCFIGEYSELDENTHLDAHVTLYDRIKVGKHVRISSGVVIGSDGFGIAKEKGVWHKVPQLGRVIIEDDVEIGANCAIDRGAIDDTVIAKGVKLDNLIQVGHNVRIGENTAIAGCVAIAGSAMIGKDCIIGGTTGINGHITITDNAIITGGSTVTNSVQEPGMYSSAVFNLESNREWRKKVARFNRLETLIQRVKALETALQEITERKET